MKTKQYNSQLIKIENKGQIQLYSWGLELDKDKMKMWNPESLGRRQFFSSYYHNMY